MKTKYPRFAGVLVALLLVISFVLPTSLVTPTAVQADPGILEWTIVDTPDSIPIQTKEIFSPGATGFPDRGSEIIKLLVANDGKTMWAIVARGDRQGTGAVAGFNTGAQVVIVKSVNGGRSWSGTPYANLVSNMALGTNQALVWEAAIPHDDVNICVVAVSRITSAAGLRTQEVWVTTDGGNNWDNTQWPPTLAVPIVRGVANSQWISALDVSMDFGGRKLLVATRDGSGSRTNNISVMKVPGFGGWNVQSPAGAPVSVNSIPGDILDAQFSPTFGGDSTIVVLYTDNMTAGGRGTFLATGDHDIAQNRTTWQNKGAHVEIKNSGSAVGSSPMVTEIVTGMIQLPSDFSGASASLRRVYVSTDAINRAVPVGTTKPDRGVYRIDDNVVYSLMDNSSTYGTIAAAGTVRRAASIAYWGTYASGKLLVGDRVGFACTATVPVWFTDSPTVCPIPCWYPAKKPPTGAAGQGACFEGTKGYGNAWVVWSPTYADQGVAYAVTGSVSYEAFRQVLLGANAGTLAAAAAWPAGIFNIVVYDESAFSLTRNNGETWNQLSLIDTLMVKLTDVAVSKDCTTVYLASVNNSANCSGFESIWRSTSNAAVVSPPLDALPIGQIWERVRASISARSCNSTFGAVPGLNAQGLPASPPGGSESNYIIIRLAPDKNDGQIVFWAAGGANARVNGIGGLLVGPNTLKVEWSPDYGDFWANINPRITVQDMAAESSTILYVLDATGRVQKMPYTGTAWASTVLTTNTNLTTAHSIEALAEGRVLVGAGASQAFAAAWSTNGGTTWTSWIRTPPTTGNFHVAFDPEFATNKTVYVADDQANQSNLNNVPFAVSTGRIYRNDTDGAMTEWTDMVSNQTGAAGIRGFYGLAVTNALNASNQPTLYAAHAPAVANNASWSGVLRTLTPRTGIPKPGISWDDLVARADWFQTFNPLFTLEPESLKFCGCLTADTDTTLYAIDNDYYANNHNVRKGAAPGVAGTATNWPAAWTVRDRGMLWAYTDCVAKRGPKLTMDDGTIIGCDPATGRGQEVNFTWEQLCVADRYQLQIAKDSKFTLMLFDTSIFTPISVTSPALIYLTGGVGTVPDITVTFPAVGAVTSTSLTSPLPASALECGHKYYWKVRVRGGITGEVIRSPWSDVRAFTIKAGFRVTTPYYGPQLLEPINGCGCPCDAPINFSWSPFKETQKYKYELSENPDMSSPVVSVEVPTTAYQYKGTIKCNTAYFWRVMASQPATSEWSSVFSFKTQKAVVPTPPPPVPEEKTPIWVWVVIAIGAILVIVTLVLIFKTRRV